MNIDARVIKLGKLFVPKTKSFFKYNNIEQTTNQDNNYISTGYFNYISVFPANDKNFSTSLKEIQSVVYNKTDIPNDDECSYQYVKVFTNIGNRSDTLCYDEESLNEFWERKSLLIFITMIHIGNNEIKNVIKNIKDKLKAIENQYVLYLTFDYSDIIIFVKSNKISEYINLLYDLDFKSKDKLYVEDSYTIYGYDTKKYESFYNNNSGRRFKEIDFSDYCENDEYVSVSINLGLETCNHLYDLKTSISTNDNVIVERMYGRHDVSIVNQNATTRWLLFALMKIDLYSTSDTYANGIILYETFLRSKFDEDSFEDFLLPKNTQKDKFYNVIQKKLKESYESIYSKLKDDRYKKYVIPIHEIKNSTLSVLKNNFAEEFVLAMLESYLLFLKNFDEMLSPNFDFGDNNPFEAIENYVNEYFKALNCLVSTVMHTDRQFIQATAFNAVFYDVPPKVVAYYTALIYQFRELMSDKNEYNYVFIFTPNFQTGITLGHLSTFIKPPVDRLIIISIEEKAMYDVESVFRRLAHEIAHYAGDKSRDRETRQNKLISMILCNIINEALTENFIKDDNFYKLINNASDEFSKIICENTNFHYSYQFDDLIKLLLEPFIDTYDKDDKTTNGKLYNYIFKQIKDYFIKILKENNDITNKVLKDAIETIENSRIKSLTSRSKKDKNKKYDILANYLTVHFFERCRDRFLTEKTREKAYVVFSEYINVLKETYSDLQSIIILDLTFKDYLKCFIYVEDLKIDRFEKNFSDIARISIISKLMFDIGVWCEFDTEDELLSEFEEKILSAVYTINDISNDPKSIRTLQGIRDIIDKNDKILTKSTNFKTRKKKYTYELLKISIYPIWCIYDYLLNCTIFSLEKYINDKEKEIIKSIRTQFDCFRKFNDIELIVGNMNSTLSRYKDKLLNDIDEKRNG